MNKKREKNGELTSLIRVKEADKELLQQFAKKLASKNGHNPSFPEVIHYILTHFEDDDDIERGIIRIFDSIIPDLEFLFQKYNFSQDKADRIIGEITLFRAIILQQVTGSLPVKIAYEVLQQVPSAVKARIKIEKDEAEKQTKKIREASPEVVT